MPKHENPNSTIIEKSVEMKVPKSKHEKVLCPSIQIERFSPKRFPTKCDLTDMETSFNYAIVSEHHACNIRNVESP